MAMSNWRRAWRTATIGLLVLLLAGAALVTNLLFFRPVFIAVFFERVFIEYALKDPELLSSLRLLEPLGLRGHNDALTDISPERAERLLAKAKRDLATLRAYDRDALSPDQKLSRDILDWFLANAVDAEPFLYHDYPVNQLFGVQNDLPTFMATTHHLGDERDARDYVSRLKAFDTKFAQLLEGLRLREERGIVPPRFVIDRVLDETRAFAAQAPTENILYTALAEKLPGLEGVDDASRSAILDDAQRAIETNVYPNYQALIAYLERLRDRATTDDGVWKLPNGDAYYAYLLRSSTTTDLTPQEVHDIGIREVARIQGEMDAILREQGHTDGTVGARMNALRQDPKFLYPDTEEGRAACIADFQSIINEVDAGMDAYFTLRPEVGVKVERIPAFKEKTAPGAYYQHPALDGSRPGGFYVKLYDMAEMPKFGMRTLAYHEAIPGHHFQIAIQQTLDVPTFRQSLNFTAYAEGWALYAEQLAWEAGYQMDPYDNLGRLQAELFRAVRLVVDTGLHYKRWTREEAIDYMLAQTGMPTGDVTSEIERYIVMPGQACAYKIGMNRILELRARAQEQLGEDFDLRAFHSAVIGHGAMPLEILARVVDDYIATARGAGTAEYPVLARAG